MKNFKEAFLDYKRFVLKFNVLSKIFLQNLENSKLYERNLTGKLPCFSHKLSPYLVINERKIRRRSF